MTAYGRDFSTIMKGDEWISIPWHQITKKKIKRYGNRYNYFNSLYGKDNWRYFYIANNEQIKKEDIIKVISKSFEEYNKENKNTVDFWIEDMTFTVNQDQDHFSKITDDLILNTELELISASFLDFYKSLNAETDLLTMKDIQRFFRQNKTLIHDIPIASVSLIVNSTKKQNWKENSIKSFFNNNLVIQVKTAILDNKKDLLIAIFIRKDLKLGKGKKGAQLAHGAVSLVFQPQITSKFRDKWLAGKDRKTKVFLVSGLKQLLKIQNLCRTNNINSSLISDAGHTQIEPGTSTCIAVGPMPTLWGEILAEEIEATELVT